MSVVSKQPLCGLGHDEVHMPLLGLLVHCVSVSTKLCIMYSCAERVDWFGCVSGDDCTFTESMSG